MARGDVTERQKRNADQARPHVEPEQRAANVRRDVAMGQHRSFGSARRSRGVDDGGQIVRSNRARLGFNLGAKSFRALQRNVVHGDALAGERREIAIEFHRIHDHDFFQLRLVKDRQDLMQLLVRRQEDGAAARVIQDKCSLFRGERGVERNRHGPEQKAGHIGDGPLGTIFAEDGDAISRRESPRHAACARFWQR